MAEKTLVALEKYLKTGSHIGTRFKTGDMRRYIFKSRKDGLKVLDVETIDSRLKAVANFLSNFELPRIVVVSRKVYGHTPAQKFAEAIGAKAITGRFMPGTFTNPSARLFVECDVLIATDSEYDGQAIKESVRKRIPVVAMSSTNNSISNIDIIIPINNKGRKSLALAYWLLARELLKLKGIIKKDEEFSITPEEFEYQLKEGEEEKTEERQRFRRFDNRRRPDRDRRR